MLAYHLENMEKVGVFHFLFIASCHTEEVYKSRNDTCVAF